MKLANLLFAVFYFQLQFNFYDASTKVSRLLDRLLMNYTKSLRPTHDTGKKIY